MSLYRAVMGCAADVDIYSVQLVYPFTGESTERSEDTGFRLYRRLTPAQQLAEIRP
jgi:hypothetical protein